MVGSALVSAKENECVEVWLAWKISRVLSESGGCARWISRAAHHQSCELSAGVVWVWGAP